MKEEIIQPQKELTIALQRNLLASIDLSDITDELETEQERKDYCSAIFAVFPRVEKKLKKMLYEQLIFQATQADIYEKILFARGTFNGIDLVLEEMKNANSEHIKANSPEDEV